MAKFIGRLNGCGAKFKTLNEEINGWCARTSGDRWMRVGVRIELVNFSTIINKIEVK